MTYTDPCSRHRHGRRSCGQAAPGGKRYRHRARRLHDRSPCSHCAPWAECPVKRQMNFGWLTGFMTPTAREHVLEHSGQVDSAIGEPPPSSWPDLIWPPRMLTADADDLGHSRNCSLAVRSLPAQVYPTIMADPGRQNPAKVREFVPVACPIRRSTPGICGHSRLARHPARKAESLPELALTSLFAGRLARSQWPISGSGDPCVSHVRWDHRSGSSGVQFAHDCGSSTAFTPVCSSTGPSPSVRARQLLGKRTETGAAKTYAAVPRGRGPREIRRSARAGRAFGPRRRHRRHATWISSAR